MNAYNFALFNALTRAIEALQAAMDILVKAQQDAEKSYIEKG